MNRRETLIAIIMIFILAYIHQVSVESNVIVIPSEGTSDLIREDNVSVLDWWEVSPVHYFLTMIGLYLPFLIPITGIIVILSCFSFGIRTIHPKNVLENKRRQDIFQTIMDNPGISHNEIENVTGINRSSLKYHLRILMREGKISSRKFFKTRHYFGNGSRYNTEDQIFRLVLNCSTTENIYRYINRHPGCTQKDLIEYTKLSYSTVLWHIEKLSSGNLVSINKEKNSNHYYTKKTILKKPD